MTHQINPVLEINSHFNAAIDRAANPKPALTVEHIPYMSSGMTDYFQVESKTNLETPHLVMINHYFHIAENEREDFTRCSCKGFAVRKTCAHVNAAHSFLRDGESIIAPAGCEDCGQMLESIQAPIGGAGDYSEMVGCANCSEENYERN